LLVKNRRRVYSHGNGDAVANDPQILQVVGRVRSNAYAAGVIVLKAAEALQRVHEAKGGAQEEAAAIADVEIDQSVPVVTDLILDAVTILFDALGSSATDRKAHALDRYWRNARTLASHNPRIYRTRIVGDFAVNGAKPPAFYRVGKA
jgi:alkylation response protein AidB-like acyl-CoA dehydrogenase